MFEKIHIFSRIESDSETTVLMEKVTHVTYTFPFTGGILTPL